MIGAPPTGSDAKRTAIYVAACLGLVVFCALFLWSGFGLPFRVLFYEPVQRQWMFAERAPTSVAMDFYFRTGFALAGGVVAAIVAAAAAMKRKPPEALVRAAGVWAVALLLIAMAWYGWTLSQREVLPPSDAPGLSD